MRLTRTLLLAALPLTGILIAAACSSGGGGGSGGDPYVHLFVTDYNSNPAPNVPVVVWTSAGTIVTQLTTDSSGNAAVLVPAGGTFGVFGYGFGHSVTRVLGAAAGGRVRLDYIIPGPAPTPTATPPAPTTANVTLTGAPAGATSYSIVFPCGSAGGSPIGVVNGLNVTCTGQTTFDLWAAVYSASGVALGWGSSLGNAASPGNTVNVPIAVNHTNFDLATFSGTFYPGTGSATVSANLSLLGGYIEATKTYRVPISPGPVVPLRYLPGLTTQHQVNALESTGGTSWLMVRNTAVATSATFDFSSVTPPTVSAVDTSLHAHPRLSWSLPGGYGEAASATIFWSDSQGPQFWGLLAPGSYSGSLTVPDLPASLSAWSVTASATVFSGSVTYQNDLPGISYQVYLSNGLEGGSNWFQRVSANGR